jgi:hypothetical protein
MWLQSHVLNIRICLTIKVKLSLCLIKYYAMKTYGGVEVYVHAFLNSALDGGGIQIHVSVDLPREKSPWYPSNRRLGGSQSRSGRSDS